MIVTYEDRADHQVGIKLLALSLAEHWPEACLEVLVPKAEKPFADWFSGRSTMRLRNDTFPGRSGYNIKPSLLRRALEEGADEAIWMDSDVIVAKDPRTLWSGSGAEPIVVAEEFLAAPHQGGVLRTKEWGLPVGRSLPNTTNSCVVRVTRHHLDLLNAWDELLDREDYKSAQKMPWSERPAHLAGDQDVLCALLGSARFTDIPIRWIRRGKEVAHCFANFGYLLHERVANLATGNTPIFFHGQGPKPWHFGSDEKPVYLEVSPYLIIGSRYAQQLGEDASWGRPRTVAGRLLRSVFQDHLTASGLLPSMLTELWDQRMAKTLIRSIRQGFSPGNARS